MAMYTVTPLVCAHTTAPKAQLLRNAGWGEQLCIASVAWLIRGQGRIMLIDTSLGGAWNDPAFAITWPSRPVEISSKDLSWPDFAG